MDVTTYKYYRDNKLIQVAVVYEDENGETIIKDKSLASIVPLYNRIECFVKFDWEPLVHSYTTIYSYDKSKANTTIYRYKGRNDAIKCIERTMTSKKTHQLYHLPTIHY